MHKIELLTFFIILLHPSTQINEAYLSLKHTPLLSHNSLKLCSNDIKQQILDLVDGKPALPNLLVCPESLKPLTIRKRIYGWVDEEELVNDEYKTQYLYNSNNNYYDLTVPSLDNTKKPFWSLSNREKIGQNFFQNPFISGIYERGYRQNFKLAGF
jgi:hypothetical protein